MWIFHTYADTQLNFDDELMNNTISTKLPNVGKLNLVNNNNINNNNNHPHNGTGVKLKPVVLKKSNSGEPTKSLNGNRKAPLIKTAPSSIRTSQESSPEKIPSNPRLKSGSKVYHTHFIIFLNLSIPGNLFQLSTTLIFLFFFFFWRPQLRDVPLINQNRNQLKPGQWLHQQNLCRNRWHKLYRLEWRHVKIVAVSLMMIVSKNISLFVKVPARRSESRLILQNIEYRYAWFFET